MQTAINCDTFWLQSFGTHNSSFANKQFLCFCAVLALFYFVFEGYFQEQAPGGFYLEGRFNGGFFTLRVGELIFEGAYTWRGLFPEFYGILLQYLRRAFVIKCLSNYSAKQS